MATMVAAKKVKNTEFVFSRHGNLIIVTSSGKRICTGINKRVILKLNPGETFEKGHVKLRRGSSHGWISIVVVTWLIDGISDGSQLQVNYM